MQRAARPWCKDHPMGSWFWILLAVAVVALSLAMMTAIRKSVGSSDKQRQGWYPDPKNPAQYRYYDGQKWTELTANGDQDPPKS